MNTYKLTVMLISLFAAMTLAACGDAEDSINPADTDAPAHTAHDNGHSGMHHSSSGQVPNGLSEAENPKYEVGSQAILSAGHMPGMEGAEATIVGAYETTVYAVSYTPESGGDPVKNHKWVIHEELENAGEQPLQEGDVAVLDADHMEGMENATATIDSAEETTVYMVDFTSTDTQEEVVNHKWVTESELADN